MFGDFPGEKERLDLACRGCPLCHGFEIGDLDLELILLLQQQTAFDLFYIAGIDLAVGTFPAIAGPCIHIPIFDYAQILPLRKDLKRAGIVCRGYHTFEETRIRYRLRGPAVDLSVKAYYAAESREAVAVERILVGVVEFCRRRHTARRIVLNNADSRRLEIFCYLHRAMEVKEIIERKFFAVDLFHVTETISRLY